ncbi:MAG: Coenzyme F420 hydrogenase/dehydrogenase, beta subunit C-terminal domain [Candidatus Thiodiazotropha sp. (ex Lucinoma kastoroae)]|nr:Coenzyme F420 hydrogenase/dehydrogenase, beta subunit C-terminal domain [Candidatus Thiodiazotropha sp. (ex Lucinoma kastoroae)]MCU7858251.1 Coenzyme F420 hydrogenase/dehydrogenase, beta subunit C-terminal domain [Candidatus Thiodiazotropha sp. (ex Lucinoma kastoroae)]
MLNQLTDRLLQKKWSDKQISTLVGIYIALYHAYASDPAVRVNAASGGIGSALLIGLLERGEIKGALICKTGIEAGKVRTHFAIATTAVEILAAQGSKYVETAFMKEALPLIRNFDGHVAVVGLPCDISNLTRWIDKDPRLEGKVRLKIALVCGHNSRTALIDAITDKLKKEAGSSIQSYCFRRGHWRGQLEAGFKNGTTIQKPFSYFSLYQNLFFYSEKKCLVCHDHFGYDADISLGDVWAYRFKQDPIKKTGVIVRTEIGLHYWNVTADSDGITSSPLEITDILDGQARSAPYHHNVSARSRVAPLVGYKIPDKLNANVSWHEWLTALMALFNMRWSENSRWNGLIFKLPRPLLIAYLYLRKGLESLK